MPILSTKYTDDFTTENNIRYFYFPIDQQTLGDTLILLNKTQIFGSGRNGDSVIYMNVQQNIFNSFERRYNYTNWDYPSESSYFTKSATFKYSAPEMIDICPEYLRERCGDEVKGCGLVIGVAGIDGRLSSFRLKGFYSINRLYIDQPKINSTRSDFFNGSFYDYFWFTINDTVSMRFNSFDY